MIEVYSNVQGYNQVPWYLVDREKPGDVARALVDTVQDIEKRQASIFEGNRRHARIYAGYLPSGMTWSTAPNSYARNPFRATKALVRSVCDTATALISRFRPKPSFITMGADWAVAKQAEDMDLFLMGAYEQGKLYPTASRSFQDTTVFGTGGWKYVPRGDDDRWYVSYERFLPDDLVVDEDECRDHLNPENTYHRVPVRGDALIRRYASGDTAEDRMRQQKIRAACGGKSWPNRSMSQDRCMLIDAVHVDLDGGPNRHVVAIEGLVLLDEVWPYEFHPYTFLWWAMPITGFYGDGIAYRQYGRQERITYMHKWVEKVHDLFATPRVFLDPRGGPPALQMSNEIGAIIQTTRQPYFMPAQQMIPPEVYHWIDKLAMDGYEDEGISQATAGNSLPPGLESAPAQREYSFKESNRFAPVSQRWEHAVAVETAYKTIAFYKRRAELTEKAGLKVRWADRKMLHVVSWPDLDTDAYHIRAAASSLDALSPAARMQAAIELSQTNWLRPGEGRALLGHQDLERADDLDNAPARYAEMVLRKLLHGEHVDIDEYADLQVLDKTIRAGRLLAIERGAPAKLIDNCSDFLDRLDQQIKDAAAAMTAGSPAGPGTEAPTGPMTTTGGGGLPPPSHV